MKDESSVNKGETDYRCISGSESEVDRQCGAFCPRLYIKTHTVLVTPYSDRDLGQHRLR